jgi:glycosyltransferase involved in cell wall biosynthesis
MESTDRISREIVLDLSRLLSRTIHRTPTGVDRVEMAYARELLRVIPNRLAFGAVHPSGLYGRIPTGTVQRFLDLTEATWDGSIARRPDRSGTVGHLFRMWLTMRPRPVPKSHSKRIFLQSSPHHLHDQVLTRAILRKECARFMCLLHDLIPITYPEYARPNGQAIHLRRMETVATLADGIIANSEATRQSFLPYLAAAGRSTQVRVAHLGVAHPDTPAVSIRQRAYFVCLGTIEARKNHLLLLNVWRRLVEQHGSQAVPQLIIIGRRGWENEQVVDMLERCPALVGCVEEHGAMADSMVYNILAHARALLLPSFAEGYGMPVSEALASGVPVICSDLAALREAGGSVPEYLDPLDGPAWAEAILEYAAPGSLRRDGQLARLRHWQRPTWEGHVDTVIAMADSL